MATAFMKISQRVLAAFLDSLYSDIDSLVITAGGHKKHLEKYGDGYKMRKSPELGWF